MTKHYSQKDNLISIMKEISKKTPRGILNGDTQVGHITWQMYLMRDYLKLDGTPLANASNDYSDLLSFAQDNNLITSDTTDNSLFKYDSTTDVLTLPDYIGLVLQGGNTVEEKEAGLPNIKGSVFPTVAGAWGGGNAGEEQGRGAISALTGDSKTVASGSNFWRYVLSFDASKSNSIYSDSVNTVQPPAITLIPQIKYRKATTMYEQIDIVIKDWEANTVYGIDCVVTNESKIYKCLVQHKSDSSFALDKSNWELVGGSGDSYSTNEQVIGTWVTGKPLYRKVFTNVGTSINSNLKEPTYKVLQLYGHVYDANNSYNFPYADQQYTVGAYINRRTGVITISGTGITVDFVCVEYTKTTD